MSAISQTTVIKLETNADERMKQSSPPPETEQTVENGAILPSDSVEFSKNAKEFAAQLNPPDSIELQRDKLLTAPYLPEPISVTTKQGMTISLAYMASNHGEEKADKGLDSTSLIATLTRQDGEIFTFNITGNTILTENEDGGYSVFDFAQNMEHTLTTGDEKLQSSALQGSSGNDIIINLLSNKVDGGDGDDVIIDLNTQGGSQVTGGAGDDTIVKQRVINDNIDGGTGDDTISLGLALESHVEGGDGDDHIKVDSSARSTIDAGSGNDQIQSQIIYKSTIRAGDGNDEFWAKGVFNSTVSGGEGDDMLSAGSVFQSLLSGKSGNDTLQVGVAFDSTIDGGDGADSMRVVTAYNANLNGGRGNDSITAGALTKQERATDDSPWKQYVASVSVLSLSEGDITGMIINTAISGGDGDDTIEVTNARGGSVDGGAGFNNVSVDGRHITSADNKPSEYQKDTAQEKGTAAPALDEII